MINEVDSVSIDLTVLLENTKQDHSSFDIEHGLSIYVNTNYSTLLFDCGHTGLACSNADLMNIDLSKVKLVVLSHSHYDHAGGFPSLLRHVIPKTLFIGKNFWRKKFSISADDNEYKYRGCGFTETDLSNRSIKQVVCEDIIKLDDDAWLIGNIIRHYDFETIPKKFVCGEDKSPDDFSDEIVLALRESDGVAVVTGCAHNGILNIVKTVSQRLNLPIYSVIGGIHLEGASSGRIERTLTELKNLGVRRLALCHCSGEEVHKYIDSIAFTDCRILTGSRINI